MFQLNWNSIKVKVLSTDRTDIVLDSVANALGIPTELIPYFSLFVVKRVDSSYIPIRRLQNFEAPYLTLRTVNSVDSSHTIIIRKSYWDPIYDEDLLSDKVATNILYSQALHDIEKDLIHANKETRRQLTSLQAKGSKKEVKIDREESRVFIIIMYDPLVHTIGQNSQILRIYSIRAMFLWLSTTKYSGFDRRRRKRAQHQGLHRNC